MAYSGNTGLTRIIKAAGYSWQGLKAAFIHEAAFRQELVLFAILAPPGIWLADTGVQRALLIGSLFLILIVELVNSAIEATIDRFGDEMHELSGRAKDIGSAAVLVAMLNAAAIWFFVLVEKFL